VGDNEPVDWPPAVTDLQAGQVQTRDFQ